MIANGDEIARKPDLETCPISTCGVETGLRTQFHLHDFDLCFFLNSFATFSTVASDVSALAVTASHLSAHLSVFTRRVEGFPTKAWLERQSAAVWRVFARVWLRPAPGAARAAKIFFLLGGATTNSTVIAPTTFFCLRLLPGAARSNQIAGLMAA